MTKKQIIRISKRDGTEQITTQKELKKVVNGYYERFDDAMHVLESGLRIQSIGYYYELREDDITNFRLDDVGSMRREFHANPATDEKRFAEACVEADNFAKRSNYDTIVFKNRLGFYLIRELKFARIDIKNGDLVPLYCAMAKFCATKASIKKVAWKLNPDHKTR